MEILIFLVLLAVGALNIKGIAWVMEHYDWLQITSSPYLSTLIVWAVSLVVILAIFNYCVEKFSNTGTGMLLLLYFLIPFHPWSTTYLVLATSFFKINDKIKGRK